MKAKIYNLEGFNKKQIQRLQQSANEQRKVIARIYWHNKGRLFAPTQIEALVRDKGYKWPITSIRRTITNLTKGITANHPERVPILEMTEKTQISRYNGTEHFWKWREQPEEIEEPAQAEMFSRATKSRAYSMDFL